MINEEIHLKDRYFINHKGFEPILNSFLEVPTELNRLKEMTDNKELICEIDNLIKKYKEVAMSPVRPVYLKEEWISKLPS